MFLGVSCAFVMPKVAFPIHLTCQNRQDLNNWLAKDLWLKHEGESAYGAEKILQREFKRFGMDCSNANDAEYLQMAMSKVAGNGAVDKVPGLWKAEWINRKRGDFGAAGFTRNLLRYRKWGVLTSKNSLEMAKRKALEQRPKCIVVNEWSDKEL